MKVFGGFQKSTLFGFFYITIIVSSLLVTLYPLDLAVGFEEKRARGVDGWIDTAQGNNSFFIDSSHDMVITYVPGTEELSFSESYDPYFDLSLPVRKAVDISPQWMNDTLVWSFLNIYSAYRMKYAEVLLDETLDSRYIDEIAFIIAYTPSTFLNYNKVEGKFLWENVHMMYTVSDDVKYASISDYNLSDGQHSTITYRLPSGNVTIPENIYYWYVVMPKAGNDNLEYMNPETGEFAYSDDGGEFWRTWLYYNNHTGYPLLKDYLAGEEYLWEGRQNEILKNGAVGAVTRWEMESVVFGMPQYRKVNPIYIYKNHLGMCGENAYMLAGVAKIALIPTVMTLTWEGNHAWNDFWERGWHQWEAYSGQIDNPACEGPYGGINAFTTVNPDFSHMSLNRYYTSTANLTVNVRDEDGLPVDGVMVKLHSFPYPNIDGSLGLIANLTDVNGETTFEIGTGFDFFVNYRAPIGGPPDHQASAVYACSTTTEGADYEFNLTIPGKMPLKSNYSKIKEQSFGVRFNISSDDIDHLTNYYEDDMDFNIKIWKEFDDISKLTLNFLDDSNFALYNQGKKFYPSGVLNISEGEEGSIILQDQKWNIVIAGKGTPLTRTFASVNIDVSRSLVTPEAMIVSPLKDSIFAVEDEIFFVGMMDFLADQYEDFTYKWINQEDSSILSTNRTFGSTFEVGYHTVIFEVFQDSSLITSSQVSFNVYQPNRPPTVSILTPPYNAELAYDTEIEFSANASDLDNDNLSYNWRELGIDVLLSDEKEFSAKFGPGIHRVELTVTDLKGLVAIDEVRFIVLEQVFPPVLTMISPTQWMTINETERMLLNATGTYDPDGDVLSYKWISSIDGLVSLSKVDHVRLSVGEHSIELQVTDGVFTESIMVNATVIEVDDHVDQIPVSIIGSPMERVDYYVSDMIEFDGSSSYDPDEGSNISFEWRLNGELLSEKMMFSTSLPGGVHSIELSIISNGLISRSFIEITVINRIPVLRVDVNGDLIFDGDILDVSPDDNITFDASGSHDPDETDLIFEWLINGSAVSGSDVFTNTFEEGEYTVKLIVTDEGGKSASISIYITSENGEDQTPAEIIEDDKEKDDTTKTRVIWVVVSLLCLILVLSVITIFVARKKKTSDERRRNEE